MEQMKNCFTLISIVIKSFENSLKEFNLPFVFLFTFFLFWQLFKCSSTLHCCC